MIVNEELDVATGQLTATVDHGDGTGTRTVYDTDGNVSEVKHLTGLAIPEPAEPDPIEALREQLATQQATIDALLEALGGGQ